MDIDDLKSMSRVVARFEAMTSSETGQGTEAASTASKEGTGTSKAVTRDVSRSPIESSITSSPKEMVATSSVRNAKEGRRKIKRQGKMVSSGDEMLLFSDGHQDLAALMDPDRTRTAESTSFFPPRVCSSRRPPTHPSHPIIILARRAPSVSRSTPLKGPLGALSWSAWSLRGIRPTPREERLGRRPRNMLVPG